MKCLSEIISSIDIDGIQYQENLKDTVENYYAYQRNNNKIPIDYFSLRLAFGKYCSSYRISDGVAKFVKYNPIDRIPIELPKFLKEPFIIEARPHNVIYDDIIAFAGFHYDGQFKLIVCFSNIKAITLITSDLINSFHNKSISDVPFFKSADGGKIIGGLNDGERESYKKMLSWVISFGIMIESERTPMLIGESNRKRSKAKESGSEAKRNTGSTLIERRIYIDVRYVNMVRKYEQEIRAQLNKDGKFPQRVTVHGFYRTQHYGKNNLKTKTIFIDPFEATRWMSDGDQRIIVNVSKHLNDSRFITLE